MRLRGVLFAVDILLLVYLAGTARSHAAAAENAAKVPIEVFAAAADVDAYPVEVGLPMPPEALKDVANVRLLDSAGTEVPLQVEPLSRYADGAMRAILLVFLAPLKSGIGSVYTAEFGPGVGGCRPAASAERPIHRGVQRACGQAGRVSCLVEDFA